MAEKNILPGKCLTTAMGIMPHTSVNEALELALSLHVPFWPQLPKYSYFEDMYVQVSEHFPGIIVDEEAQRIHLDKAHFFQELFDYMEKIEDAEFFQLSSKYSIVLDEFLDRDLSQYQVIRGQNIGPISFGLKIVDKDKKPIIYDEEIRVFLFDFIARKVNAQYEQLLKKNKNSFVWLDEPGLQILFGSFTGYSSSRAKEDFRQFLEGINGPRGVHLCGNPDWSFLLTGLELDVLSIDTYSWGHVFTRYFDEVVAFLKRGGIISWGIVPTLTEEISREDVQSLANKLENLWDYIAEKGVDKEMIIDRAWIAPSRCCLVNPDGTKSVNRSFEMLREISSLLKEKYSL